MIEQAGLWIETLADWRVILPLIAVVAMLLPRHLIDNAAKSAYSTP